MFLGSWWFCSIDISRRRSTYSDGFWRAGWRRLDDIGGLSRRSWDGWIGWPATAAAASAAGWKNPGVEPGGWNGLNIERGGSFDGWDDWGVDLSWGLSFDRGGGVPFCKMERGSNGVLLWWWGEDWGDDWGWWS